MKEINYTKFYKNYYKNIPNYVFWCTFFLLGLGSFVVGLIFLLIDDGIWALLAFLGPVVALGIAYLNRFFVAVKIAQKVVVADSLLSMRGNNESTPPPREDKLPEL